MIEQSFMELTGRSSLVRIGRPSTVTLVAAVLLWTAPCQSQQSLEPYRLVDSPTAGLIDKGRFSSDLRLFPDGGMVGQLSAGVLRRLTIGISFGGTNIIGDDDIDWYPRVEPSVRYRVMKRARRCRPLRSATRLRDTGCSTEIDTR